MTNNPEFENLEELLAGYVLGNLDEEELAWLNKQLMANPELREQVTQLKATLTLMPYSLPEDVPQTDLRSQILAKAQAKSPVTNRLNRWGWIIGAITTLSTVWLGLNSYNLRQQLALRETQLQKQQELIALLRQPNNRLVSLRGFDNVTASGSLFIAPKKNKAVLALQNLQPLPGKQVYRLWAISQEKTTGCVNFTPDEKGTVHLEFADDALTDAHSVLVTIEPEADTVQPEGSEILTGSYSAI